MDKEILEKLFYYDETSPTFLRHACDKMGGSNHKQVIRKKGDEAGGYKRKPDGKPDGIYVQVVRDGNVKHLAAHRVIMILHNHVLSTDDVIDHIDGNGFNNHISNLRVVDTRMNARNRHKASNNKTGITGVCLVKETKRRKSHIRAYVITDSGKHVVRCFDVGKYGYDEALRLGTEWRSKKIAEMNANGGGWTDRHGKQEFEFPVADVSQKQHPANAGGFAIDGPKDCDKVHSIAAPLLNVLADTEEQHGCNDSAGLYYQAPRDFPQEAACGG